MEPLSSAIGLPLYWVQNKAFGRQFELRAKNMLFGTLRFEQALGTLATAESESGSWTLKRVGFLNVRVTIREAGRTDDLAVYWPRLWGDGWLETSRGSRFHWLSTNFWRTEWGFAQSDDRPLFVMKKGTEEPTLSDLLKSQAVVEIEPEGNGLEEISLLLMLGWYLMILHQEDTMVGTTAAITAVTS
ncbi:MAG TPA: hypothetical protein PK014_14165 [Thermoanaerobaculia bacterium]|nr:hypothetical protein [Thermoanaerobaculia bacterium]HUM31209.1 hypothetical protein [Thermoanaerobaculia bacterium]HXK69555.1 hypothetical protein [Thermoanaerobaculia bacterium]